MAPFRGNAKRGVAFPSGHEMNPRARLPRDRSYGTIWEHLKDLGDNEEQGQNDAYGKPAFLSDPLMSLGKSTDCYEWVIVYYEWVNKNIVYCVDLYNFINSISK